MGLFTVASEKARMDALRAGKPTTSPGTAAETLTTPPLSANSGSVEAPAATAGNQSLLEKIEAEVEKIDTEVKDEFESLIGHKPAATSPTTAAEPTSPVTTGTTATPIAPHTMTAEQKAHADSAIAKQQQQNHA